MNKINWKVRFSRENSVFIIRFILSLLVPILVYMGLQVTDLTSWGKLGDVLFSAISNPYIVGMTIVNAINLIPDPTTKGTSDSELVLNRTSLNKDVEGSL